MLPLMTSYLGAVNFGVWSQVLVVVATITPLVAMGTDSAAMRYLPGRPEPELRAMYTGLTLFLLASSGLAALIILLLGANVSTIFFGAEEKFQELMPLAALNIIISITLNSSNNWLLINNKIFTRTLFTIAQVAINLIAISTSIILNFEIYHIILITILGDAIVLALLITTLAITEKIPKPNFSAIWPMLRIGVTIFPAGYAVLGLNMMDRFFLLKFRTMEEIGVYSLVYGIGSMIVPMISQPFWTMYPAQSSKLYNQRLHAEGQRLFNQSAGIVFALLVPTIVGSIIVAQPLIAVMAPVEFENGAPLLSIIVASYAIDLFASYFAVSLGLVYRQYWTTVSLIFACLINLGLNIALIPRYGAAGAAIATLIAFTTHFLICFFLSRRWPIYTVSSRFILKVITASILMGAIVYPLQMQIKAWEVVPFGELAISATLGVLVYILFMTLMGLLSPRVIMASFTKLLRSKKAS